MNCRPALSYLEYCLSEHDYNPNPETDAELCKMAHLELKCMGYAIVPTSCPGQQEAVDSLGRVRVAVEEVCGTIGSAAKLPLLKHF